jgi:hypothetical protein
MNEEAISLGWRCESAQIGVTLGLRSTKSNGYNTCPFDLHNSNYPGIIECIKDDFKYLTDPKYLEVREGTFCSEHFAMFEKPLVERQIVNTYYGFVYNHESPGHANLYLKEGWEGGINHFVDNNFKKFIERYNARVENFRNYLSSGYKINFMMMRYNAVPNELCEVIQEKYPNLDFEIHSYINYSPYTYSMTHQKDDNSVHEWEMEQWRVMGMSEEKNPSEFERYKRPFAEGLTNNYPDKIKLYAFE